MERPVKTFDFSQPVHSKILPENIWDERYGKSLNPDEKKEIEENLTGFFELLNKLNKKLR